MQRKALGRDPELLVILRVLVVIAHANYGIVYLTAQIDSLYPSRRGAVLLRTFLGNTVDFHFAVKPVSGNAEAARSAKNIPLVSFQSV